VTLTDTPSQTPSRTATLTASPTLTATPTSSFTVSPTISPTFSPGLAMPYSVALRVYDSSGLLLRSADAGRAAGALGTLSAAPQPFDPGKGTLAISDGTWTYAFDGKDSSGAVLRNGVYLFVLEFSGPSGGTAQVQVQVVGSGGTGVNIFAAPNPARPSSGKVSIYWSPVVRVELKVYELGGGLVQDFGLTGVPPMVWDLKTASGQPVANGIYVVSARVPGERSPRVFKLMVAR
jgi:hypothetical protein